jgi:hypothetical protein
VCSSDLSNNKSEEDEEDDSEINIDHEIPRPIITMQKVTTFSSSNRLVDDNNGKINDGAFESVKDKPFNEHFDLSSKRDKNYEDKEDELYKKVDNKNNDDNNIIKTTGSCEINQWKEYYYNILDEKHQKRRPDIFSNPKEDFSPRAFKPHQSLAVLHTRIEKQMPEISFFISIYFLGFILFFYFPC